MERRLRCAEHVFNLIVRAPIGGTDEVIFFEALSEVQITVKELRLWRERGPLGTVINTIVYIRASPQRDEASKKAQREHPLLKHLRASELHTFDYTGWNSVFDAYRVSIHLRPAVDEF